MKEQENILNITRNLQNKCQQLQKRLDEMQQHCL
jgi:hypothetical protein